LNLHMSRRAFELLLVWLLGFLAMNLPFSFACSLGREESAKLASEQRPGLRFRGLEAESVPRAVASEAPVGSLLRELRSLPLAVLTRRPNAG
jgi:hypothetical protein